MLSLWNITMGLPNEWMGVFIDVTNAKSYDSVLQIRGKLYKAFMFGTGYGL